MLLKEMISKGHSHISVSCGICNLTEKYEIVSIMYYSYPDHKYKFVCKCGAFQYFDTEKADIV